MKKVNIDKTAQLCEVGDKLYRVTNLYRVDEAYVEQITIVSATFYDGYNAHWAYSDDKHRHYFNETMSRICFKTKKEAQKEIQRQKDRLKKKELLKEYERKLNKKFDLGEDYIIK